MLDFVLIEQMSRYRVVFFHFLSIESELVRFFQFVKRILFLKTYLSLVLGLTTQGPNVIGLFCLYFTNFLNKLECLSLASLSSLTQCLLVRQGTYLSKAPSKCSIIGQALSINLKQKTKLERPVRNKHSSLLRKFRNHGQKKFYNIGPRSNSRILTGERGN